MNLLYLTWRLIYPAHLILNFYQSSNIDGIIEVFTIQFSPSSISCVLSQLQIFSLNTLHVCSSICVKHQLNTNI